ncbi:MAG: hypothetical protein JETT_1906 [Candidatus Jettenia ecosi]|uniref:Protein kinase domain-containing protein n=1 Tax=Candidatus Jettenia ecosi TaxID=2494326 RepID=A0A533QAR7_9BACT|nr:MAG: hypothetical protein JETT_1906 [Candidatus Jettenia ecosi]
MGFVKFYQGGYKLSIDERFQDITKWLLENIYKKESHPFHTSRHSIVWKTYYPALGELFIKTFKSEGFLFKIKDLFRGSRAYRAWKAGEMLESNGFCAPEVVAIGEKRSFGLLQESFLVTLPVKGSSLMEVFSSLTSLKAKREMVYQLGREIGKVHKFSIIHGDLLPVNIFIVMAEGRCLVYLLDNERTKQVSIITAKHRIKNLVQLNRMVVSGITASDRIRFFDAYLEENQSLKPDRNRMLKRIGEITVKRVMKHRKIPLEKRKGITFRALMAWK